MMDGEIMATNVPTVRILSCSFRRGSSTSDGHSFLLFYPKYIASPMFLVPYISNRDGFGVGRSHWWVLRIRSF